LIEQRSYCGRRFSAWIQFYKVHFMPKWLLVILVILGIVMIIVIIGCIMLYATINRYDGQLAPKAQVQRYSESTSV
jgi:hypothetical protein